MNSEKGFFHAVTSTCRGGEYGHYTQVISQLSREVGCANAVGSDGNTVYSVCNYSPHGNLVKGEAYAELYPNQRAPRPGGVAFENLNRAAQLDLRFDQCLQNLAGSLMQSSNPQGASDQPGACNYTKVRAYDSGANSGLTGYTGTAEDAAGYLIGMLFKGQVLGLFGGLSVSLNPLRVVLVTGE